MTNKIFISYRRKDIPGDARSIYDYLSRAFGSENIFMDVDQNMAGLQFENVLSKALDECEVLIAVIGPRWLDILRQRQLDGEYDIVEIEIATAMKRNIVIIPVIFDVSELPKRTDLPDTLKTLPSWQRTALRHESFGRDMADFVDTLADIIDLEPKRINSASAEDAFIKRLTDVPAFLRPHVQPPNTRDKWIKEESWQGLSGFVIDDFAVLAKDDVRSKPDMFLNLEHNMAGDRKIFKPPSRVSAELSISNPPGRMLPLNPWLCLYGFDGRFRLASCSHDANPIGRAFSSLWTSGSTWEYGEEILPYEQYWDETQMRDKPSWDCGYHLDSERSHLWRTFTYDFEADSPLLILHKNMKGPVSVIKDHIRHFQNNLPSELFMKPDWSGGIAQGAHSTWSVDFNVCFIEGTGKKYQSNSGYLLLKDGDSYRTDALDMPKRTAIALHPSGLVVKFESKGNDLALSFYDPWSQTLIYQQIYKGFGYNPNDREYTNLSYNMSFSRNGDLLALEIANFEKVILIDLIKGVVLSEIPGVQSPSYSPDGNRLLVRRKADRTGEVFSARGEHSVVIGAWQEYRRSLWCSSARRLYLCSEERSGSNWKKLVSLYTLTQ